MDEPTAVGGAGEDVEHHISRHDALSLRKPVIDHLGEEVLLQITIHVRYLLTQVDTEPDVLTINEKLVNVPLPHRNANAGLGCVLIEMELLEPLHHHGRELDSELPHEPNGGHRLTATVLSRHDVIETRA
ncbi:MAG: hypothetical protein KA604_04380 [Candidatus Saccharimonas sp.]|nr:hypothetical protein [Candidatus Saccharimonas sp.]